MLQSFVSGLKSRHDDVREKAAKQMQQYVETDLREVSADENASFVYHSIFEIVSRSELHEKKGGVMAISKGEPLSTPPTHSFNALCHNITPLVKSCSVN